MQDQKKTKAQLVGELAELRQRLSELDGSVRTPVPREAPHNVERRRVKERRAAEVRYHDLFDDAPDMFLSVDPETTTIQVCNQTLATASGYTKEEIVGRPIFDLYHPDYTEDVQESLRSLMETGEVPDAELQLQRWDGSKIDVLVKVSAVRDEQGKVRYSRSVLRDITERKKTEQALLESEELFRQIAEAVRVIFFVVDHTNYSALYVNPAYEEIWGRTCESLYQEPTSWLDAVVSEDRERVNEAFEEQRRTGKFSEEFRITRPDGSIRWIFDRVFPIRNPKGEVYRIVGVAEDITERKRAEETREQAVEALTTSRARLRKLAARLQEVREEERIALARELHDELGQILTAAQMDLGWIRSHAPPDSPKLMRRIREAVKLLKEGVDTVQELSSELRPPALDVVGLQDVLADQVVRFGQRAQLDAEVDLGESAWPLRPAAQTVVFRIVQEALTNVARHARASRVRLDARCSGGRLLLALRDDGIGIGERELEAGDSLGLVGMAERALSIGGSLEIRRPPEGGTDVVLEVPLSATGAEREVGR